MEFPEKIGPGTCQVEDCSGWASTQTATRMHFWHWNVWDTVVILKEGNLPHPRCPLCVMLVTWRSLNGSHQRTSYGKKRAERKQGQLAEEEERAVTSWTFSAYGHPLEMVTSFRYPRRAILATDNDCPEVIRNLVKTQAVLRRMMRILIREGGRRKVSVFLFKYIVQSLLLFNA